MPRPIPDWAADATRSGKEFPKGLYEELIGWAEDMPGVSPKIARELINLVQWEISTPTHKAPTKGQQLAALDTIFETTRSLCDMLSTCGGAESLKSRYEAEKIADEAQGLIYSPWERLEQDLYLLQCASHVQSLNLQRAVVRPDHEDDTKRQIAVSVVRHIASARIDNKRAEAIWLINLVTSWGRSTPLSRKSLTRLINEAEDMVGTKL